MRYYRPVNYTFADVRQSIIAAKAAGVFVSLNLLYFPGITDTEAELSALVELITACKIDFIQLRNLNIDPEMYLKLMQGLCDEPAMGLHNFRKRLRKECDWLNFGYFNPAVNEASAG